MIFRYLQLLMIARSLFQRLFPRPAQPQRQEGPPCNHTIRCQKGPQRLPRALSIASVAYPSDLLPFSMVDRRRICPPRLKTATRKMERLTTQSLTLQLLHTKNHSPIRLPLRPLSLRINSPRSPSGQHAPRSGPPPTRSYSDPSSSARPTPPPADPSPLL